MTATNIGWSSKCDKNSEEVTFKWGPKAKRITHAGKQHNSFPGARRSGLWGLCGGGAGCRRCQRDGQKADHMGSGSNVPRQEDFLLSGHGRPLGVECCCSLMLFQVKPSGHGLIDRSYQKWLQEHSVCWLIPLPRIHMVFIVALLTFIPPTSQQLWGPALWGSLPWCQLSALQKLQLGALLSTRHKRECITSFSHLIHSNPRIRPYQTLGGTEAPWGLDTGQRPQGQWSSLQSGWPQGLHS